MFKKLSQHGNSYAIIIDKPILDLLSIDKDTVMKITTDGKRIIIEPTESVEKRTVSENPKVQSAFEEVMEKYEDVFRKLSRN
jgi:antitoxin MazE